ncbi:hypothetical protein ACFROC_00915 [Nocardia tengchongensis]|uniref:hypothetical protein n=1 Tax=Nocardia tengchongensis TaxID=2055889 RepID=UPI0036BB54B2
MSAAENVVVDFQNFGLRADREWMLQPRVSRHEMLYAEVRPATPEDGPGIAKASLEGTWEAYKDLEVREVPPV